MDAHETLIAFVEEQLAKARQTLKGREDMVETYRGGTDEEWAAAADMHPTTRGHRSTKADRDRELAMHERIAVKNRLEVQRFTDLLVALQGSPETPKEEKAGSRMDSPGEGHDPRTASASEPVASAAAGDGRPCRYCGDPQVKHTKSPADWRTVPGCGTYKP